MLRPNSKLFWTRVKYNRIQTQADIKEFWVGFHGALSRFLDEDGPCFELVARGSDWENHFFGEIEADRLALETRKDEVQKFMEDQKELVRWKEKRLTPSLGALDVFPSS